MSVCLYPKTLKNQSISSAVSKTNNNLKKKYNPVHCFYFLYIKPDRMSLKEKLMSVLLLR